MTEPRIYCSVHGCHRWSAASTMERRGWTAFVCGSHWRRATKREKALLARLKRQQRRIHALTGDYDEALGRREWLAWKAVERRVAKRPPAEPCR
ncbi:hypothetical protein [Sphingomonas panaciterrae]|uniref:hypothetical protein n=1 Tax=Sphingomonas panaciterrae TaxID=1462999 RepID=UPI002FF09F29